MHDAALYIPPCRPVHHITLLRAVSNQQFVSIAAAVAINGTKKVTAALLPFAFQIPENRFFRKWFHWRSAEKPIDRPATWRRSSLLYWYGVG